MTIRDELKALQKPYSRVMWFFGLIFCVGGIGAVGGKMAGFVDSTIYVSIIGILYLVGFAGLIFIGAIMPYRIRCPKCDETMRGRWKKWNYCPYCSANLDAEVPTQANQTVNNTEMPTE